MTIKEQSEEKNIKNNKQSKQEKKQETNKSLIKWIAMILLTQNLTHDKN